MSIVNSVIFMNSLRDMKKGVEKEYYRNFIHITHTDLDGVSCSLVDHLGPQRIIRNQYVETVYTPKMVPELYTVIENTIKKWIHAQKVYKTKIEDLWVLITDFGSIEIDKLNEVATNSIRDEDEYHDANPKSIHFIVIDHHQSKYTKIDTSAPIESSVDYYNRFSLDSPYKLSCGSFYFKANSYITDVSSMATAAHQEFTNKYNSHISVDMFICNNYCASMLWFILANKIDWTDKNICDRLSNTSIVKEYFYYVNEYDLGRQGNFLINLDELVNKPKIDYIKAIIENVSPQIILNAELYRHVKELAPTVAYRYFVENVFEAIILQIYYTGSPLEDHNTHTCITCGQIIPQKIYDYATDTEYARCPICGSRKLIDNSIEKEIRQFVKEPNIAYSFVNNVVKMIYGMNVEYNGFTRHYAEENIDDSKPHTNHIFMGYDKSGEPATMSVDFPEDKNYRIFYQVHRKKLPEEVNIHTFAKLAMEDMDKRGIHYDMSMIFQPNDDGNMICQMTANPNNINNINCYDVAVLNGGGGHPGAAGFPVTKINTIYEVKDSDLEDL